MDGKDVSDLPGVLSEIAEIAGRRAALEMALRFGGSQIYIPHARRVLAAHLRAEGRSSAEIADLLSCTRQTARQYLRGAD